MSWFSRNLRHSFHAYMRNYPVYVAPHSAKRIPAEPLLVSNCKSSIEKP